MQKSVQKNMTNLLKNIGSRFEEKQLFEKMVSEQKRNCEKGGYSVY